MVKSMLTLKNAAHIRTMRQIKSFRAGRISTGVSAAASDRGRILFENGDDELRGVTFHGGVLQHSSPPVWRLVGPRANRDRSLVISFAGAGVVNCAAVDQPPFSVVDYERLICRERRLGWFSQQWSRRCRPIG